MDCKRVEREKGKGMTPGKKPTNPFQKEKKKIQGRRGK